jgi:hypothetical protein
MLWTKSTKGIGFVYREDAYHDINKMQAYFKEKYNLEVTEAQVVEMAIRNVPVAYPSKTQFPLYRKYVVTINEKDAIRRYAPYLKSGFKGHLEALLLKKMANRLLAEKRRYGGGSRIYNLRQLLVARSRLSKEKAQTQNNSSSASLSPTED